VAEHLTPVALWLIPAAPLSACVLIALMGARWLGPRSHWPCILAIATSLAAALWILFCGLPAAATAGADSGGGVVVAAGYEWIRVGAIDVRIELRVDALGAVMLSMVTLVSLLVAVYSAGYMRGDPGYPRFFAEFALFVFSMCMLVLAGSFLVLYVFWEGVGLCSYLLIGFWFRRPSAAAAARKAFLVNRIGDFGFLLGLFLVWTTFGTLDYDGVFGNHGLLQQSAQTHPGLLVLICLCLFLGAVGKSAQFPLHVWLPDAMEGPTPVSALIHAATMVTAGVYLVARCMPLFSCAPWALLIVAGIGAFTALLAALIALTQNDLKRVLAYSTVSQLGYMFLALGCGAAGEHLVPLAVTAAMFHLFTHAFFKALLFLGAGSVMHAMGDVIDMRRFGGLRKVLPITHGTFLCGAAALAGVPLLSGFWSKDEILAAVGVGTHHAAYASYFLILQIAAVATALLTAFYTFRAYFLTFWGAARFPEEAGHHPHEAPAVMRWPLIILAVFALSVGGVLGPTGLFGGYLQHTAGLHGGAEHASSWTPLVLGSAAAVAGIGLAAVCYLVRPQWPARWAAAFRGAYAWSLNKFYFDELYAAAVVRPLEVLATLCRAADQYLVDGLVDLVGRLPGVVGRVLRPVQNGVVSSYGLVMLAGLAVLMAVVLKAWMG
jgi:NADH-quinone oxidoreductase subunit L